MKHLKVGVAMSLVLTVATVVAACQTTTTTQPQANQTVSLGNKGGQTLTNPTMQQIGDATVTGRVLDKNGQPIAGALVVSGESSTKTAADGSYTIKVKSGELVNVKIVKDGFIIRDGSFNLAKGESTQLEAMLVKADANVTRITAATGGKAVSADGKTELIIPAGALKADANVRVTWLNAMEDASKPAAFRLMALADAAEVGGTADPASTASAPVADKTPGINVKALNTTDLPGPLETTAYGDRKFFSPVAFADVSMTAALKDGESATLRMAVADDVLADMKAKGDLKDTDLGQDIFPCFSWSADASTWDKPALSKVVKDEKGQYWFEYTVRPTNMTAGAAAGYQTLAVGDETGNARVELQVGGGRRVVDGTYTYGALIEKSSDPAFDMKGISATLTSAHYSDPDRSNFIRPNFATTNYTGTTYASTMGAAAFEQWDRNGMYRLAYPPGDRYAITGPTYLGLGAGTRTGRSSASSSAATYVTPFYYNTDATVTINLTSNIPVPAQNFTVKYTWRGQATEATINSGAGAKLQFTLPRAASGSAQAFSVQKLTGDLGFMLESMSPTSLSLAPGGSGTMTAKLISSVAK